jgi:hypothetical protein
LNWTPWVRVVDPGSTCLDELAGRNHRGMSDEGDEIALAAGFNAQNAEAVLGIVERDPVDQPSQNVGWAFQFSWRHDPRMMNRMISRCYRGEP